MPSPLTSQDVRALFHRLWTKAVGTKDYVKAEWAELESVILAASLDQAASSPTQCRTTNGSERRCQLREGHDSVHIWTTNHPWVQAVSSPTTIPDVLNPGTFYERGGYRRVKPEPIAASSPVSPTPLEALLTDEAISKALDSVSIGDGWVPSFRHVALALLQPSYESLQRQISELEEEKKRLQVARIGDTEIIGRWMCQCEKAETELAALQRQHAELQQAIRDCCIISPISSAICARGTHCCIRSGQNHELPIPGASERTTPKSNSSTQTKE